MIRTIRESDASECLDIYNYYIANTTATFEITPLALDTFKNRVKRIIKYFPFLVYEENNEIIGYAYLDYFIEREASFMTTDLSIYIKNNMLDKGIGAKLLNEIIRIAPNYSISNIISVVTTDNIPSQKFHEKHGFKKEATINDIAIKMNKSLGVIYYKLAI